MSDAVDTEQDTAPVPTQEPKPSSSPRPFIARNLRRFAPVVILAWLAFLVAVNVVVPQLEPVVDANREALVPVDAPSVKALKHIGEVFHEGDSNALVFVVFEADQHLSFLNVVALLNSNPRDASHHLRTDSDLVMGHDVN